MLRNAASAMRCIFSALHFVLFVEARKHRDALVGFAHCAVIEARAKLMTSWRKNRIGGSVCVCEGALWPQNTKLARCVAASAGRPVPGSSCICNYVSGNGSSTASMLPHLPFREKSIFYAVPRRKRASRGTRAPARTRNKLVNYTGRISHTHVHCLCVASVGGVVAM